MIEKRVAKLIEICDSFLQPIYKCELPYGMRIVAKTLRELAESRFTDGTGAEIGDSLVGGFIFLRFFSPAIVDPNTLDADGDRTVPASVRRNKMLVTKVLQTLSNGIIIIYYVIYLFILIYYVIYYCLNLFFML